MDYTLDYSTNFFMDRFFMILNLAIWLFIIATFIYFLVLLIKALKKYLKSDSKNKELKELNQEVITLKAKVEALEKDNQN